LLICFYFSVELNKSFEDVEGNMYTVNNDSPPDFDLSHHTSLKRKKPAEIGDSVTGSPAMEKSHSVQADMMQQRPASMVVPYQAETSVSISPSIGSLNRQVGIPLINITVFNVTL
jgi:hypothetical protein